VVLVPIVSPVAASLFAGGQLSIDTLYLNARRRRHPSRAELRRAIEGSRTTKLVESAARRR
jgi:hypothetical protein